MKLADEMSLPRCSAMIRELRQRLSLTQAELAAKLGVKANTVARWESAVSEPYVWNYWMLYSFSAYQNFWSLAEFFNGRIEISEEQQRKWDPRYLLRHLEMVRARARAGEEFATRLMDASGRERSGYLKEKVEQIFAAFNLELPPELNSPYELEKTAEGRKTLSEISESHYSKLANALAEIMREAELADLLRAGRDLERVEIQKAELKRQRRMQMDETRKLRERFELFQSQRKQARGIIQEMVEGNAQGILWSSEKPMRGIERAFGLEETAEKGSEDQK